MSEEPITDSQDEYQDEHHNEHQNENQNEQQDEHQNEHQNEQQDEQQSPISFQKILDQIVLNLKVMGDIKDSDKLSTINSNIEIDTYSYVRCIFRTYNRDSRIKTVEKLQEVVDDVINISDKLLNLDEFSDNIEHLPTDNSKVLQDLIPDMINSKKGLRNLKLTYKDDVLTENKLDMLIKKLGDQVDKIKGMMKIEIINY